MLNVRYIISSFFQLALRVSSKLTPYVADKGLKISKVFLKKSLEVRPYDWNDTLIVALLLDQSKIDGAMEKCCGKQSTIYFNGTWNLKIIFTLLRKVVVVYVRFS